MAGLMLKKGRSKRSIYIPRSNKDIDIQMLVTVDLKKSWRRDFLALFHKRKFYFDTPKAAFSFR